jgi:hypothetical protein
MSEMGHSRRFSQVRSMSANGLISDMPVHRARAIMITSVFHKALKSFRTSPNFLITLASLNSPVVVAAQQRKFCSCTGTAHFYLRQV